MSICATPEELERSKELQLEAQSRESIKAWCDDQSVQLEYCRLDEDNWMKKDDHPCFDLEGYYYRIAKPKKWYRVCVDKEGEPVMANKEGHEALHESASWFSHWIDERKYYD